jgi:hypothetical protein
MNSRPPSRASDPSIETIITLTRLEMHSMRSIEQHEHTLAQVDEIDNKVEALLRSTKRIEQRIEDNRNTFQQVLPPWLTPATIIWIIAGILAFLGLLDGESARMMAGSSG